MELKIHVPEPCHENWDEMTAEAKGRHCAVCSKIVVDFTEWETVEIIDYLKEKKFESVCGRFKNSQLEENETTSTTETIRQIWFSGADFLKKIAAVILVAFGLLTTSCESEVGKVETPQPAVEADEVIKCEIMGIMETPLLDSVESRLVDSLVSKGHTAGLVNMPKGRVVLTVPPPPPPILGDVQLIGDDTSKVEKENCVTVGKVKVDPIE